MKRTFYVDFGDGGDITIELDEKVISVVDDEWRASMYNLHTPEEIAAHIASNLVEGSRLSRLDGWADQPDENARIVENNINDELEVNFVKEL
jgi:Ser-tRNA(Ala) deacylase AlaX